LTVHMQAIWNKIISRFHKNNIIIRK
jgi:hypothetical protein